MNAVFQQAILIIDTLLVGGLGEEALVAMGIAASISAFILGIVFALANGAQILIAQAHGACSKPAVKSGFWSGLLVGLTVALIGVLVVVVLHQPIVGALAKTSVIAEMTSSYLLIFTIAIVGIAISQNISVYFYSTGRPKLPFYSKVVELPVNAFISWVLIYGLVGFPALGLQGAAIGSAIAVLLRALFLVSALVWSNQHFLLNAQWLGGSFLLAIKRHLKNALPIAGTFISMNMSFSV